MGLFIWLPETDEPQTTEIPLIVNLYRKRKRAFMFSLGDPIPPDPLPAPYIRENIMAKALEYHKFLKEDHSQSYLHVNRHFGVTMARASQLIGFINRFPKDFIDEMKDCRDRRTLKTLSGKILIKISKLRMTDQKRRIKKLTQAFSQ